MKKLLIIAVLLIGMMGTAQTTFEQEIPTDFISVGLQIDPFGSIDKEGVNFVASLNVLDFKHLDWEISTQNTFSAKYTQDGKLSWDYTDIFFGPQYLMYLSNRHTLSVGIHIGVIFRPEYSDVGKDGAGWTYGFTTKGRWFLGNSKKLALIISGSLDRRPDISGIPFKINGRGGLEFIFN